MDYSADDLSQTYYFAVFNGTQETFYPYYWGEENCMLVRCDAAHGRECATFPLCSDDVFHHVNITANFSSPFIYPAVIHNRMRLTPRSDWDYNTELEKDGYRANVNFHSDEGRQLVVVGLKARTYRLDPASSFF
ncbi:biotinidase [Caerostris darwini]|uniref:Biotinidase n=1 Tax=Caerostris darwini TaxID=1538125 RepID=A0AAV4VNG0_9ARAC|nr:biotinidase [Caerostris darwini]